MNKLKPTLIILFLLLAAAFLVGLTPLRYSPGDPSEFTLVAAGQETYVRQLEIGALYESYGRLDEAEAAYRAAAEARQVDVAQDARNGLERVAAMQENPLLSLHAHLRAWALQTLDHLLPLSVLFILGGGFIAALRRPVTLPGYQIQPFEDFSKDKLGNGLHSQIHFFLQEARHALLLGASQLLGFATPEFPLFTTIIEGDDALENFIGSIQTVKVGGLDVPFGKLWLALRQWNSRRQYAIGGMLHQLGGQFRLYAEMRNNGSKKAADHDNFVESWELCDLEGDGQERLAALSEELAYRLLFYIVNTSQNGEKPALSRKLEAGSWRSLQLFTRALQRLQRDDYPGRRSQLEKARELLEDAITIDPNYLTAIYALGFVSARLGDFRSARNYFQDVIDLKRHLVLEATYNLGLVYYQEFSLWGYERAIACFEEVLTVTATKKENGGQPELLRAMTWAGLGGVYAQMVGETRDREQQQALLEKVDDYSRQAEEIVRAGSVPSQDRLVLALVNNARGIANFYAGQELAARRLLKEAIQLHPDNPIGCGYIALTFLSEGRDDMAHYWLRQTRGWEPVPQYIEYLHYKFGRFYHKKGQGINNRKDRDVVWEQAVEFYLSASNKAQACYHLGEIYEEQGQIDPAIIAFRRASKINPRHAPYWLSLAYMLSRADNAVIDMGDEIEEQLSEAGEAADRAIQLDPDDWQGRDLLGWVFFRRRDLGRAVREITHSLRLNNQVIQNHYHLAVVLNAQGSQRKALETIEKALATPDKSRAWRKRCADLRQQLIECGSS